MSQAVEPSRNWDEAAAGWTKWWQTFERAAQVVSDRLIDMAGVQPGWKVLDIATGIGEPAVSAARKVGPTGKVLGFLTASCARSGPAIKLKSADLAASAPDSASRAWAAIRRRVTAWKCPPRRFRSSSPARN